MNITNLLNHFRAPTPAEVAANHLRTAQLQLLEAHGEKESATARVNTLQERVRRLTLTVETLSKEDARADTTRSGLAWTQN
jgi:hypothetical protein